MRRVGFGGDWLALQNSRLLYHAGKVRDRLFVDDRRLGISRLLDFRQVAAGQDREKAVPLFFDPGF